MTTSARMIVWIASRKRTGFLDVAVSTAVGPQELERDVEEQDTADGLQVGNAQEDGGQGGKENAQSDRASAAEDDRPAAIFRGKAACRHPDDDGVVARKHEVDDDNAEDRR